MAEGIKKYGKSFLPYNPLISKNQNNQNDITLDPTQTCALKLANQDGVESVIKQQKTDIPFLQNTEFSKQSKNSNVYSKLSYDGTFDLMKEKQKYLELLVTNSLDGKLLQRPIMMLQPQLQLNHQVGPTLSQSMNGSFCPILYFHQNGQQKDLNTLIEQQLKIYSVNNSMNLQNNIPKQSTIIKPKAIKQEQHFKKEEITFLNCDESCQSEVVLNEESSWNEVPINQKTKKINKKNLSQDSSESYKITKKKKEKKVNDTKNITKNFSKAIISYIINNPELLKQFFTNKQYEDFLTLLKNKKNQMTNIKQLRDLWVDSGKNSEFNKVFRIISQYFLRNQSVAYVYNSRISNTIWHLKYRQNLLRALKEPENFRFIKDL